MELEIILSALSGSFAVYAASVYFLVSRKITRPSLPPPPPTQVIAPPAPKLEVVPAPAPVAVPTVPEPRKAPALEARLSRTRSSLFGRLTSFLGRNVSTIPAAEWESLEEILLEGDVGVTTTEALLGRIKARARNGGATQDLKELIREESEGLLSGLSHGAPSFAGTPAPFVISIVGVNGAGKTTTIGKLAQRFATEDKKVLLGACDTFRAAAIGQLKVWSERSGAQFVTGREGADPGAVAFDSVTAGKARGMDVVLLDTAGRLHTKTNLMEELKKIHRVIKKVIPEAPHETWLVLDGTSGQNAVQQAKEFQKTLELTGVIITKLDGTAKGGAILSVASELKLPIKFIGLGEGIEDLVPFEPRPFVNAILGA